MKPRKKVTSRYEIPWHLLDEDEKAKVRKQQEREAVSGHQLTKIGMWWGCTCLAGVFTHATSRRDAESSLAMHIQSIKDSLSDRREPDYLS